jgi:hypothetical protein
LYWLFFIGSLVLEGLLNFFATDSKIKNTILKKSVAEAAH